ncbi:MAG TPA: hypothetical protein VFL41_06980 [Gaiellaceae bacterium]|nr:hypothetical protein [Gaiellaceae bacterium]
MTTTPTELASRDSGSIAVALFWDERTNELLVTVAEASSGDSFALEIADGPSALDAFYHPYAYASHLGIPFTEPLDAAATSEPFDFAEILA